jgi:uncharacterized membrane protein YjgN (DUF898 family)
MDQIVEKPVATLPDTDRVAFTGERAEFRSLVMRGAFLELVTLGFYRFWLATDMRRHLWSNTSVAGDAVEYTGTAKELLIGFLFALAIMVPVYLVYFFIGLESERVQAFSSIPLVLFFYVFAQFAIYRARRYRLTRTIWRGVRFWMAGSGWSYAWRASLWALLVLITFGVALPWYQAALERYKMKYTSYGNLPGHFDGTGWRFFKMASWIYFAIVAWIVLIVVCGFHWRPGIALLILVAMVGWPFAYAAYKAAEWRWWVSGVRFGEVRFESKLPASSLFGLYWKVIGWSVLFMFVLSAWVGVVVGSFAAAAVGGTTNPEDALLAMQQIPVLVLIALGYIATALAFGVVVRIYLRRDIWARVASSVTVFNLSAATNVTAEGELAGALGEGLADSLDVGGF